MRCIRLTPYEVAGRILLDVRQVIPLPEARDYQVRLRRKEQEQERALREGRDFTRYHIVVDGVERPDTNKRRSILSMVQELVAKGVAVADVAGLLSNRHVAVVGGVLTERDAVEASMVEQGRAPDRFVLEEALHADGKTYIVSKMWGPRHR